MTPTDIARALYRAYEAEEPSAFYEHLGPDPQFFSPSDPGIDLNAHFERCWPTPDAAGR
jgi:hypothetical protein